MYDSSACFVLCHPFLIPCVPEYMKSQNHHQTQKPPVIIYHSEKDSHGRDTISLVISNYQFLFNYLNFILCTVSSACYIFCLFLVFGHDAIKAAILKFVV